MASQEDLDSLARVTRDAAVRVVKPPPPLPEQVLKRFPELREWQESFKKYLVEDLGLLIKGGV